ncbi:hypothetical protein GQ457_13G005930 [Hibiscus cannabinus]
MRKSKEVEVKRLKRLEKHVKEIKISWDELESEETEAEWFQGNTQIRVSQSAKKKLERIGDCVDLQFRCPCGKDGLAKDRPVRKAFFKAWW